MALATTGARQRLAYVAWKVQTRRARRQSAAVALATTGARQRLAYVAWKGQTRRARRQSAVALAATGRPHTVTVVDWKL